MKLDRKLRTPVGVFLGLLVLLCVGCGIYFATSTQQFEVSLEEISKGLSGSVKKDGLIYTIDRVEFKPNDDRMGYVATGTMVGHSYVVTGLVDPALNYSRSKVFPKVDSADIQSLTPISEDGTAEAGGVIVAIANVARKVAPSQSDRIAAAEKVVDDTLQSVRTKVAGSVIPSIRGKIEDIELYSFEGWYSKAGIESVAFRGDTMIVTVEMMRVTGQVIFMIAIIILAALLLLFVIRYPDILFAAIMIADI